MFRLYSVGWLLFGFRNRYLRRALFRGFYLTTVGARAGGCRTVVPFLPHHVGGTDLGRNELDEFRDHVTKSVGLESACDVIYRAPSAYRLPRAQRGNSGDRRAELLRRLHARGG